MICLCEQNYWKLRKNAYFGGFVGVFDKVDPTENQFLKFYVILVCL